MTTPIQQLVTPDIDPLYHQMLAAYHGDPLRWHAVTVAMRDAMVDHAVRNSPYFRERISTGAAFEDTPVLGKRELREHHETMVASNLPQERRFFQKTSGSTAEPVRFYRDRAALLVDAASDRFMRWLHGIPFASTLVVVTSTGGGEPFTRRDRIRRRIRSRLLGEPRDPWLYSVRMTETGPADLSRELDTWGRFESYFLLGHASAVDWIADQIEQRGLPLPQRPVAVVTNADQLTELARQRIERVFGVPVHTRYGTTEIRWMAVSEPGSVERYLFNPLSVYAEIVDEKGHPVPDGTPGRLVLTDLHNFAMPLIRYDQGDVAVRAPDGWAGGFPVFEQLLGREPDLLRLPSGKMLSSVTLGNHLFIGNEFSRWIRFYQCAQTGPNSLELRVVWRDAPVPEVRGDLTEALGKLGDPDTDITIRDVDQLDRLPSGKVWIVRREF